jgi:hypothetical protein
MEELRVTLFAAWGVVTAVLIVLLLYRSALSSKEDDQIFIDTPEQHHFQMAGAKPATAHYREQQEVIAKIARLTKPILALAVTSAVLLLAGLGIWAFQGLQNL